MDWGDLRYFLAVARDGSTLAAGRRLRVSQTTVARRITALEAALDVRLFDRRASGYALTPVGDALLANAQRVESEAQALIDKAAATGRESGGVVRLTVIEIYAVTVLTPILLELRDAHPEIHIELDTGHEIRDLADGAADISLRTAVQPAGAGLIGRRLRDDTWSIYCSRDYAEQHGRPSNRRDFADHRFIGGGGYGVEEVYGAWLRAHKLEHAVALHHDSITGLLAAVRGGAGVAGLPCLVADADEDLLRCLPPAKTDRGLWLLTHERLRHVPRIRTVLDFLAARLGRASADG